MKKLLFLVGILFLAGACAGAFASKKHQKEPLTKEPFTYVEIGAFTESFKNNGLTLSYGLRKFYKSNLAMDSSLFVLLGFNKDFVVAYKQVGLFYLPPIKSIVTPYIGIGGISGMVTYKDIYKERYTNLFINALAVLGCDLNIKDKHHILSATYYLNSNSILLSVGRVF